MIARMRHASSATSLCSSAGDGAGDGASDGAACDGAAGVAQPLIADLAALSASEQSASDPDEGREEWIRMVLG